MKEEIKSLLLSLGADVCGIAHIDRFCDTPAGFHPKDIFPGCTSVIVYGIALPKGLTKVDPRLVYAHFNSLSCPQIDAVGFKAAKEIERLWGGYAVALPSDDPYEYWDKDKLEGRGLISMKHAAVLAGLGALGKSTMLLNANFGNLLTLGAILTDLNLPSDPLAENICVENCHLCIHSCPAQAIEAYHVNQLKCRQLTFGTNARGFSIVNCNKCRTVCPMRYGQQI